MKSSRLFFLMAMASTVSGLFSYNVDELRQGSRVTYEMLLSLVERCDCTDLKDGKKELAAIQSFYKKMKDRSTRGCANSTAEEKGEMWGEIFKKRNARKCLFFSRGPGKTLAEVAADKARQSSSNSFCALLAEELDAMKEELETDVAFI